MELYLVRHGIAADISEYDQDEERPLTDKGREKTRKVAEQLYAINVRWDLILISPLVRAQQTAEILKKAGLSEAVETFPPLAPSGEIEDWIRWYDKWRSSGDKTNLALVGHQPNLGNWAEILLWGSARGRFVLKKAGVIGLLLPETGNPVANCEMVLFTSPKWLVR